MWQRSRKSGRPPLARGGMISVTVWSSVPGANVGERGKGRFSGGPKSLGDKEVGDLLASSCYQIFFSSLMRNRGPLS